MASNDPQRAYESQISDALTWTAFSTFSNSENGWPPVPSGHLGVRNSVDNDMAQESSDKTAFQRVDSFLRCSLNFYRLHILYLCVVLHLLLFAVTSVFDHFASIVHLHHSYFQEFSTPVMDISTSHILMHSSTLSAPWLFAVWPLSISPRSLVGNKQSSLFRCVWGTRCVDY